MRKPRLLDTQADFRLWLVASFWPVDQLGLSTISVPARPAHGSLAFSHARFRLYPRGNFLCNLILNVENILKLAIEPYRPQVVSTSRADQLRCEQYPCVRHLIELTFLRNRDMENAADKVIMSSQFAFEALAGSGGCCYFYHARSKLPVSHRVARNASGRIGPWMMVEKAERTRPQLL